MVRTTVTLSQKRGPELLLRCVRVRPHSSPSFQAVLQGQIHHLISLLTEGKASVLDVNRFGESLIAHATSVNQSYLVINVLWRTSKDLAPRIPYSISG